ncbi:hypothetical protein FBUS_06080 [Fasciolopsis buskii]|uniref:DOCKER domain-containing protein n=1 Tax=Fasciolopsis buskii TaxID=27845 RepID=A0A8E0VRL6_9TREM|nr:hypothetical protein FBUS_06080 [Fasciolopsis buski]
MLCTTVDHSGSSPVLNVSLGHSVLMALAKCYHDLLIKPAYQDLIDAYLKGAAFTYSTVHYPYMRLLNSILRDLLDDNLSAEEKNSVVSPLSPNGVTDPNTFFFNPSMNFTREVTSGSGRIDEKAIEMIFSTVGWAFRVIVRSRQLELESLSGDADLSGQKQTFIRQVDEFLSHIIRVTLLTNHSLPLKIVNAFSQIIRDLSLVYPRDRLSRSIVLLLERMIDFPESPNRKLLSETIESQLFEDPDCRQILMPTVRQTMTKFFSDMLSKELTPNRLEKHMVMELWCDTMLTFISRFIHVTQQKHQDEQRQFLTVSSQLEQSPLPSASPHSSTSSHKQELMETMIASGFVRWIMQQLGRVFIFVHEQECSARSSGHFDEPHLRTRPPSPLGRFATAIRTIRDRQVVLESSKQSAPLSQKGRNAAIRLQDVCGCLTSVLLTLLEQFDNSLWCSLLTPSADDSRGTCAAACLCSVCSGLALVPVFDFVHELISLFSMMHTYPAYPAPKRKSVSVSHNTIEKHNEDGREDTSAVCSPNDTSHNNRHPIEFGGAWIQMLMAASTVELHVLRTIIDVTLKPMFVAKTSENRFQPSGNPYTPSSDSARFMAEHTFTTELVNLIQHCLGSFVVQQSHLCVEALPAVLRSRVDQSLYGRTADLRESACDLLVLLWDAMNERSKAFYIPMILPTVIDMTTVPLSKIRENCVNLIFDAIRVSPGRVERVFVSEIDRVMQWAGTGFAADMYRLLGDRFRLTDSNQLDTRRKRLITDLLRQIECLLNYGEFLNHPSRLSEMLALHNLRTLYESIGRKDMMLRYLYRLEGLHAEDGNVTERGYTLQMLSKQYTWSEEPVDTSAVASHYVPYGDISSRALRERLLLDSLDCLKEATDFEGAIEVCDQLIELYRSVAPNFPNLSRILREQAELYERVVIANEPRLTFYYYLLTLHGPGFASFLTERTNCLIYRTQAKLINLVNLLHEQFPQATVLNNPPEPGHVFDHPCIFPSGNVKPVPVLPAHIAARGVDAKIKSYYLHNRVECFTYLRPVTKSTGESRDRPQFEQIRHYVAEIMPGTMPIMPVIRTERKLLSPTELAIDQVGEMIRLLESRLVKVTSPNGMMHLNEFVGTLTSSIKSPVAGGLPKLLEPVELSDDIGQESSFSTLSDSVLELLELQLAGLETWYQFDPPPGPGVQLGDANATGNFNLQTMVDNYETLVRDMSCKFGFAVSHLRASHLRYGPDSSAPLSPSCTGLTATNGFPSLGSSERRASSGATTVLRSMTPGAFFGSAQPTASRVFHRFDSTLASDPSVTIRSERHRANSRPSIDMLPFKAADVPSSSSIEGPSVSSVLLATEPPPLPDRPNLTKPSLLEAPAFSQRCASQSESDLTRRHSSNETSDLQVPSSPFPTSASTYDRRLRKNLGRLESTTKTITNPRPSLPHSLPPVPTRSCASDRGCRIVFLDSEDTAPPLPERQPRSAGSTLH